MYGKLHNIMSSYCAAYPRCWKPMYNKTMSGFLKINGFMVIQALKATAVKAFHFAYILATEYAAVT